MPAPLQTLLTGFGPFGTVVNNPTERLVRHFQQETLPGLELIGYVFPTSFQQAPARMRAILEIGGRNGQPFDIVLMLGVASGSKGWRVERVGRNHDDALTDADGFTPPAREIVPGGPAIFPAILPLIEMTAALRMEDLPATISDTAGAYLCNHLLYTTLYALQNVAYPVRAGFLHVPADTETFAPGLTSAPMFPFEQHVAAVTAVLQTLTVRTGENRV